MTTSAICRRLRMAAVGFTTLLGPAGTAPAETAPGPGALPAAPAGAAVDFLFAPAYATGLAPYEAAVADMDGDGDADVVTVDLQDQETGTVSVALNDGAGAFGAPAHYPVGPGSAWLAVGDVNADGRPDVAVSNSQAQDTAAVTVYLNGGNGTLVSPRTLAAPDNAQPQGIAIADWNGDGRADVAVALFWTGQVKVFWGDGTGSFPSAVVVGTGFSPRDLVAAEFDGDGRLDLAVSSGDGARVFYGTGSGFTAGGYLDNFPYGCDHVAAGDFNRDGHADFVSTGQALTVFLNDGTGHGWSVRRFAVGENAVGLATGDVDGDGNLDVAAALYLGGAVSFYWGDGTGGFTRRDDWGVGLAPNGVALGDVDGDTKMDALAPSSQLSQTDFQVLRNAGGRTFLARRDHDVVGNAQSVAVADFDGDGNRDVIVAVAQGNMDGLKLLLGNGDGTMQDPALVEAFGNNMPTRVIAADLNADGWMDAAASIFSPGNSMRVWLNDGAGTLLPSTAYPSGGNPGSLAAGDINGDGHLDVVVVNSAMTDNTISVFIGTGGGAFLPAVKRPTLLRPSDLAIADFDRDGDRDVLVTHVGATAILLFVNNGQGNLTPVAMSLGLTQSTPQAVDMNGDGWLDVVLTTGLASVLFNDGNGGFVLQQGTAVASGGTGIADFDIDGDMDVVAADFNRSLVAVLLNDGSGALSPGAVVPVGYQPGACTGSDFSGDALPEIVTANDRAGSVSFVINASWTVPLSATVVEGILVAGGVQEVRGSDDTYMVVRPAFATDRPVRVQFEAVAPTDAPSSMVFTLEARAAIRVAQQIALFDWAAASWVTVDERPATQADQTVTLQLADPDRFVEPGTRRLRAEVTYRADQPLLSSRWSASIDRVSWVVGSGATATHRPGPATLAVAR